MSDQRPQASAPAAPRLLQRVRQAVRVRHYSARTEESYVAWIRRFVRFNAMRHPAELGAGDINRFVTALAESGRLSASTQTQALSALLFLYRHVLRPRSAISVRSPARRDRSGCRWCSTGTRSEPCWRD